MIVQVVQGLCCSQMSETRLYDCAGCSRALLFINVRLDCMTVQVF